MSKELYKSTYIWVIPIAASSEKHLSSNSSGVMTYWSNILVKTFKSHNSLKYKRKQFQDWNYKQKVTMSSLKLKGVVQALHKFTKRKLKFSYTPIN